MKRLSPFLLASLVGILLFAPAGAFGQIRIGSHLALNFDGTDLAIGVNAHVGVNAGDQELLANPSVDFFLFNDNVTITRFNLDVAYPFMVADSFTPYIGAGVLVQRVNVDVPVEVQVPGVDYNDTDFGLNFFLGAFFMPEDSPIRPFGRVAANVGAGTGISAQAGASFRISK